LIDDNACRKSTLSAKDAQSSLLLSDAEFYVIIPVKSCGISTAPFRSLCGDLLSSVYNFRRNGAIGEGGLVGITFAKTEYEYNLKGGVVTKTLSVL
jgi:hypothetical protein